MNSYVSAVPANDTIPPKAREATVLGALLSLTRRWRALLAVFVLAWSSAIAYQLIFGRQYEMSVGMMTIQAQRGGQLGLAAASLLGAGAAGGMQSSPMFISSLATSRSVLDVVGAEIADSARHLSVIELVTGKSRDRIPAYEVAPRLRRVIDVSADRQLGLITVSAHHRDSVVTRVALRALIRQTQFAFQQAMRQQAEEQRLAQSRRVDSAAQRLRRAEEELLNFSRANRVTNSLAESSLQRQQLQRAVEVAQSVNQQAAADRESAIARELEDTPAVVVVDPLPSYATPLPRHLGALLVAVTIFLAVVLVVGAVILAALRQRVRAHGAHWAVLQQASAHSALARFALRHLDR